MNQPKEYFHPSRKAFCVLALIFLSLITIYFTSKADDIETQALINFDLGTTVAGVTIVGANEEDHLGGNGAPNTFGTTPRSQPMVTGDFNKDGINDLVIGAPDVDYTPLGSQTNRSNTGAVYIIFGRSPFTPPAIFDTNINSQSQPDIKIFGAANNDNVGFSLAVGDINADGFDDLLIGAPGVDPGNPARVDAGAVYIMLGAQGLTPKTIDLQATNAINIAILGDKAGDKLGSAVASGEVGGNGNAADIFAGAPGSQGPDIAPRANGGAAFLLYGGTGLTPAPPTSTRVIDLTAVNANVKIFGAAGSGLGSTLAIGDINGTAPADLIIGAPHANRPNTPPATETTDTGAVYVAFGGDNLAPTGTPTPPFKTFDTTVPLANPNIAIYGADASDHLGSSVAAGDITGDGIADLALGAPEADGPSEGRANAGEVYVLPGATGLTTTTRINVPSAPIALTIFGAVGGDRVGATVAMGRLNTTLNQDGFAELLVGAPGASSNKGAVSAFYGGATLTAVNVRDLALGQDDVRVIGQGAGDELGWSIAALDLDNNRGGDLAVGAPFADIAAGPSTVARTNCGKAYVLFAANANVPPVDNPPVVQISAPITNVSLLGGSQTTITWTASDSNGNDTIAGFEIRLSIDGGTNFNIIIANVAGSARSFVWNVPTGLNTTQARLRIIATDNTGLTGQNDSPVNFTITDPGISVDLVAPNGGEQLSFGQTFQISWTVPQTVPQDLIRGFDLFLSTDGGTTFTNITPVNPLAPALGAAVRTFAWTVPSTCSTSARVLVTATSTTGAKSSKASANNFTISGPGPTINTNSMNIDTDLGRLVLKIIAPPTGPEIVFADNVIVAISNDTAGTAFFTFSKPPKLKQDNHKLVTKGTIMDQNFLTFFPNNAVRILRVTNPPCGTTTLRVRRVNDTLVVDTPAPGATEDPAGSE